MTGSVSVQLDGAVASVELCRPPHNYLDHGVVAEIADALDQLERDAACRAVVLCAAGKSFSAGADLARPSDQAAGAGLRHPHIYKEALRLFAFPKPIVAAVHGAAVGAGIGLALVADFRIACPEARFSANFSQIGFHAGFGITETLPRLIGQQEAALMLYTGRRLNGEAAKAIGLADMLTDADTVRAVAFELAHEIAGAAPLAVMSVRRTLRRGLLEAIETATERELMEQNWLRETDDFQEGKAAVSARRPANFTGR